MNSSNFNYLPRGMEAANIRQEIISHNIANVNTPNYKKSNLVFETLLAKELYGEEAHQKIMKALAVEKAKDVPIYAPNLIGCSNLEFEGADEEERLFFDSFSNRYFQSTISRVLQAEYYLNRNFTMGMIPSLNDFYDLLGLEHTKIGDNIGWTNSDGSCYWIDFNHYKATIDGTMECWVIDSVFLPDGDFLKDF